MQVTLWPPTQMVSPSCCTCTRPRDPGRCPGWPRTARGQARADEPLGQCGVQAAGHGVFGQTVVAREEGAHFKRDAVRIAAAHAHLATRCRRLRFCCRPHHAHVQPGEDGGVWLERQHLRLLASSTARQPRPLSHQACCTMSSRATPRPRAIRATSASSSGPLRRSGGAANASRSPCWRMVTRPTPHSCTMRPPLRLAARLQPGVAGAQRGVAGKGSSPAGRRCARGSQRQRRPSGVGGSTKVASDRLVQRVNCCISSVESLCRPAPRPGVATSGGGGEHINLLERAVVHGKTPGKTERGARQGWPACWAGPCANRCGGGAKAPWVSCRWGSVQA